MNQSNGSKSEEKYRILVENGNEAIFITQDGFVKFPNPKSTEITGYSFDELASMPFYTLVHPDDKDMVAEQKQKSTMNGGFLKSSSFRIVQKNNETLWVGLN